jgi:hypothetical protein
MVHYGVAKDRNIKRSLIISCYCLESILSVVQIPFKNDESQCAFTVVLSRLLPIIIMI